ncbi:H-NS family nucleoid-associated regulatory protein [Variovorax sp. RCC_210]|uniref:H-NS histone family protein n=1 Tax=Variovorax sp. RCC_210 TaxID=3239217 RepID=UPI0035238F48
MAQTLAQITKQIEKLQKEADALRQAELKGVVDRIKVAISHYGLTPDQLGFGKTAPKSTRVEKAGASNSNKAAAPRFANNEGQVWSGRGPRPHWLREALANGRSLQEFSTDAQKRSPKADADSKQGPAVAAVVPPPKAGVVTKRTKAAAKKTKTAANPILPPIGAASTEGNASGVVEPKAKGKVKTTLPNTPRVKKASASKASPAAAKSASQPKAKRANSVAAAAKKVAPASGAEKAGAVVSGPAGA